MTEGTQVASLHGVIGLDDQMSGKLQQAERQLDNFADAFGAVGGRLTDLGGAVTTLTAPLGIGLGMATTEAMAFDEAMTNVQAVLGLSDTAIAGLSDQILAIGAASRAGPQEAALAFYDIVGGVADASTHMAILNQAIALSEAGSASLTGSTSALIAVMNSYGGSAEDAAFFSDVLTQTVGRGVGTMDEFAAALPSVTGLAASLGIEFENLGGMTAYLTTQGNSAAQATTQLAAMMTALLNPNQAMEEALRDLGYETGQAAVAAMGLDGTYQALAGAGYGDNFGEITGSVEALRGATALTNETADEFMDSFTTRLPTVTEVMREFGLSAEDAQAYIDSLGAGLDGATERARNIQLDSVSAQFDLLTSSISAMGITLGTALLPPLNDLMVDIQPIVAGIADWITQNPELTLQIAGIAAALAIAGPILIGVGMAISSIGTIIGVVTPVVMGLGLAMAPLVGWIGAVGIAIAVLIDLIGKTEGGFAAVLGNAARAAEQLVVIVLGSLVIGIQSVIKWVQGAIETVGGWNDELTAFWGDVSPSLQAFYDWFSDVFPGVTGFIEGVMGAVQGLIDLINDAITQIATLAGMDPSGGRTDGGRKNPPPAPVEGERAAGGPVMGGKTYLVGEEGPELFKPDSSGEIIPNGAFAMAGGGGMTINFAPTVYANSYAEGREATRGALDELAQYMKERGLI